MIYRIFLSIFKNAKNQVPRMKFMVQLDKLTIIKIKKLGGNHNKQSTFPGE